MKYYDKIIKFDKDVYICWTGGKDSTASILLAYINNIPIKGVVMSEVMFSHVDNISGEHPLHINWVYSYAIPFIKSLGYNVIILRDKSDYLQEFNHIISRSSVNSRIGKKRGFFIGGMCIGNDRLKMRPLRNFFKNKDCIQIVGLAYDEQNRLNKDIFTKNSNKFSLLNYYKYTEIDAYNLCLKFNLLSPIYNTSFRSGCWFCPNASISQFAYLKKHYYNLYSKLLELSFDNNLVNYGFKYGMTFTELDKKVDLYNNQLSIFDYLDGV